MVYVLAGNGQEGGLFFSLVVTWYTSSIVLAPLCGDVHKRRVYICEFLEEDGYLILILARFVPYFPLPGNGKGLWLLQDRKSVV